MESVRSRLVKYGERDVIPIRAKLRYTTMIILPKEERILDFTCGDKDYWAVEGNENSAFIKPAKAGSSTNVNLITASGNIYSLVLTEVSETDFGEPDMKVFVEPKDQAARREIRCDEPNCSRSEADLGNSRGRGILANALANSRYSLANSDDSNSAMAERLPSNGR